jgi:hypothetical protein
MIDQTTILLRDVRKKYNKFLCDCDAVLFENIFLFRNIVDNFAKLNVSLNDILL